MKETLKICPQCGMTLWAGAECPICGESMTYAPRAEGEREKLLPNRYLLLYLARKLWFPVLCLLIALVRLILVPTALTMNLVIGFLLLAASLYFTLSQRRLAYHMQWKYSPEYAAARVRLLALLSALLGCGIIFIESIYSKL